VGCEGAGHDAMLRPRPFGGLAVLQAFAMPLNCLVHEPFTGVRHGVASFPTSWIPPRGFFSTGPIATGSMAANGCHPRRA